MKHCRHSTATQDVFLVLLFFNSYPSETATKSMRAFELLIGTLVLAVLGIFIALLVRVGPDWEQVFRNYLPNPGVINDGGLYVGIGIIGATAMPHAFYLGSKLATIERYRESDDTKAEDVVPGSDASAVPGSPASAHRRPSRLRSSGPSLHMPHPTPMPSLPLPAQATEAEDYMAGPRTLKGVQSPSIELIQRHVTHASIDIASSLLCFALVINSAILIVAAAAFNREDSSVADGDLFNAHALIRERLGQGASAASLFFAQA